MINPIIDKFESLNTKYKFEKMNDNTQFEQQYCYKGYCLKYKNGTYPNEFETGDYGWKSKDVFPIIRNLFTDCFGQPNESIYNVWGRECQKAIWEYKGYKLCLSTVYTHPKTDGWYISIEIFKYEQN